MTVAATISSTELTAGISAQGAELQHLTDAEGNELQWDGDPTVWNGRAPILFPVIGLLENGVYRYDGKTYTMPKHEFARHSTFDLVEASATAATFRLAASAASRVIYPFEFRLDVSFLVDGASLTIAAAITNAGTTAMPASFGFHPAFRWPLPYGQPQAGHRIRFDTAEPAPIWRIDADGFLLPDPRPTPVEGDTLVLRDELFVADAIIFDRLHSRHVRYGAPTGPQLDIDFTGFPTLGVWTKPDGDYVCIEPWQGFSDPAGFAGDIRDKPGIIEIPAGGGKTLAMRIILRR